MNLIVAQGLVNELETRHRKVESTLSDEQRIARRAHLAEHSLFRFEMSNNECVQTKLYKKLIAKAKELLLHTNKQVSCNTQVN